MSLWEYHAAVAGWNKAQSGDKPEPPTDEEFDQMVERSDDLDEKLARKR